MVTIYLKRPHPAFGHPLPEGEGKRFPSPSGRRCLKEADEGDFPYFIP